MPKLNKECIDEARQALINFGEEELSEYVRDVFARAKSYEDLGSNAAFKKAIEEINNDTMAQFLQDATTKANNLIKYEKNSQKIKNNERTLQSIVSRRLDKSSKNKGVLSDNVISAQDAAKERLTRHVFDDATKEDVRFLADRAAQYDVADAFDGLSTKSPIAKKWADKIKDYNLFRNENLLKSNAMSLYEFNNDRLFRQTHVAEKLLTGGQSLINAAKNRFKKVDFSHAKNLWREFIKTKIDLDKTFSVTDALEADVKLSDAKVDEILDRIFDNITTGKSEIFTKSSVVNDKEAIAKKSKMFFHWKGMRSQLEYNEKYGHGDLFALMMSDIRGSANKIGMADIMGESPYSMFLKLEKDQQKTNRQSVKWFNQTGLMFKDALGSDKVSVNPTLSNFFMGLRSVSSMARLVKIGLTSTTDIAYAASFAQRWGNEYWRPYFNHLTHLFNAFPTEERRAVAKRFKTMTDAHLGYMGRFVESTSTMDVLNKITTGFFKANFLEAFDRGNKISAMHVMSDYLAKNSSKTFGELNTNLQQQLSKFITPQEWELLRKKTKGGLFTTDNADALTNEELKAHHASLGLKTPLYDLRNELYRKVHSIFAVTSENVVLSPTTFERTFFGEFKNGQLAGELMKSVLQFKMYTLSYIDRVLMQGWRDSDTAGKKLQWGLSMLMGTLPLSAMTMYFENISNGVSMPDWDRMTVPQRMKTGVQLIAPSLGLFMGLLDPQNQNSSLVMSLLGSPSLKLIGNGMSVPLALATGNVKNAKKNLMNAMNYVLPIQTTPFLSPYFREILGEEARLEGGQQHLYGQ